MLKSIEIQILEKAKKARGGLLYFENSFASDAAAKPVNKALERLVKSGELQLVPSAFMSVNLDSVIMITILALSLFIYKTKMTLMFGRFEIVDAFEAIQKEFSESSFS